MHKHADHLSRLGTKHDLGFSSQEMLKHHVMGLDGINRKILVLNIDGDEPDAYTIIDLNKVMNCSVIKQYGGIPKGELATKPLELHLHKLLLNFSLAEGNDPVQVVFYDHLHNDVSEVKYLEAKARNWKTLIAKLRMPATNSGLVLRMDDYKTLISYLNGANPKTAFDRGNAEALQAELKKATLVDKKDFPADVVRINSMVWVKSDEKDDVMQLMLVTPDKANIKERKISVMAPMGTALIGFRKGQKVTWRVPAGERTFTILEVNNEEA